MFHANLCRKLKGKNIVTLKLAAAAVDEVISYLFLIKLNFDDDVLSESMTEADVENFLHAHAVYSVV